MTISLCFYRVHITADCNTWLTLALDNANNMREGDTYRVFGFWISHYFKGGLRIFLHAPNTEWLLQTCSQCKPYTKSCRLKVRTMAATKYFPGGKLLERKIKRKSDSSHAMMIEKVKGPDRAKKTIDKWRLRNQPSRGRSHFTEHVHVKRRKLFVFVLTGIPICNVMPPTDLKLTTC